MPTRLAKVAASLAVFLTQQSVYGITLAADLQTAAALEHAVLSGQDIHVVLDLSRCVAHGSAETGPMIHGSLHPNAFMVLSDHTVAFAETHFTVRPDNAPVDEFLSYRVKPDGKVTFRTVSLNLPTYAIIRQESFDCEIGKGVTFNGPA
jgi:hypothetical protein